MIFKKKQNLDNSEETIYIDETSYKKTDYKNEKKEGNMFLKYFNILVCYLNKIKDIIVSFLYSFVDVLIYLLPIIIIFLVLCLYSLFGNVESAKDFLKGKEYQVIYTPGYGNSYILLEPSSDNINNKSEEEIREELEAEIRAELEAEYSSKEDSVGDIKPFN